MPKILPDGTVTYEPGREPDGAVVPEVTVDTAEADARVAEVQAKLADLDGPAEPEQVTSPAEPPVPGAAPVPEPAPKAPPRTPPRRTPPGVTGSGGVTLPKAGAGS